MHAVAALVAATVVFPTVLAGQTLSFLGIAPGAPRVTAEVWLRRHHGEWSCARSTVDSRFSECRGRIAPEQTPALTITASLIGDSVGVLLLSGPVPETQLLRWRADLEAAFGPARTTAERDPTTWQWIRNRRMLRIAWRPGASGPTASVSLVDGRLLDGLGPP